ncbi:OmpA family protein [Arsukibacterium sp.]|uniref:OmpA family protein n=1 Tax=Arsukibacterium sp. TaxID=1977258 RepID=UPI002FD8D77B
MKLKITTIAVLAALPFFSQSAIANSPTAQELDKKVFGSVFGEMYWTDRRKTRSAEWDNVNEGWGMGLELGYRINQNWGVRAEYARQSLKSETQNSRIGGDRYGLDAMYHLDNMNVYILAGLKHYEANRSFDAANIGVGYRHFLNSGMALFVEGNRYQALNNGSWADAGIKVGASWIFGAQTAVAPTPAPAPTPVTPVAPVAPAVVDSDGDGVPDNMDKCPNTPRAHKVDAEGCTVFTETMGRVGDVDIEVRFGFDSAVVTADQRTEVDQLAAFMKRFPESSVVIEGHASNTGNPAYNMRLSERRAKAVADMLISQGVAADRITSKGFGVTQLRVQGNTPEAHAANQRIEAKVTAKIQEPVLR